jgi:hypothetical protein
MHTTYNVQALSLYLIHVYMAYILYIYILHTYYIYYEQDPKKVQRKYSSNEGTEKSPAHFWARFSGFDPSTP